MSLTLILGPMKSGKSLELIARIAPYEFADKKVLFIQPARNVRDDGVVSRSGLAKASIKVASLRDVADDADVIGIDEIHMFEPDDIEVIKAWRRANKGLVISGLDLDYRGELMVVVKKLLEQRPDELLFKKAVCDVCKSYEAIFTQILHGSTPVTRDLPPVVPDDGTYSYESRCRDCFVLD